MRGLVTSSRLWPTMLAASCAAILAAGCDGVPLLAPSGTAITLLAGTNVLPLNSSTDITAVLIEGGQTANTGGGSNTIEPGVGTPVHDGTVVVFSTTLGRVEPAEARTHDGRATVKLISDGRSGIAVVRAFSGGASQSIEVPVGAAAATRLQVTATPQSLPAGGGTSAIQARVEDQYGNGLAGIAVSFATTTGSLSSPTSISNADGVATTDLTTGAAATVTASSGGSDGTLTGEVAITIGGLAAFLTGGASTGGRARATRAG